MDKIEKLRIRRQKLLENGKKIREKISEFSDLNSFVEFDAYSFSHNEFYGEDEAGEGVVTGFATVEGSPVYIVAQNAEVLSGGVSYANCRKIRRCIDKAVSANAPIVYFLDSLGVQVGEGMNVLEGLAEVLGASYDIKGDIPQFAIVLGKVYGSIALLCANCDYTFTLENSEISYSSPAVIAAASGKNIPSAEVAGEKSYAFSGISTISVKSVADAKEKFTDIMNVLPAWSYGGETDDDLNRVSEELNEKFCPKCLEKAAFDDGRFIEFSENFCPEVKVGLGAIGGVGVGAIIFDGGDKGVEITSSVAEKIRDFARYANQNDLPIVTFVNVLGIKTDLGTSRSTILKEVNDMFNELHFARRISVVCGKAIGLGYTLFAAKSAGVSYSFAFANAEIALFDGAAGAIELGEVRRDKLEEIGERYSEENADPINAARNGFIDDVVEPQFLRPYLASALQML